MSANCKSCGKMMVKPEDYSGGNLENPYCSSCTNTDGSLKSLDEITLHIANQLIMSQGIDREAATKAARSILSVQPEWKKQNTERKGINKLLVFMIVLVFASVSVAVYMLTRPKINPYFIDPFYAYYLDEECTKLGFSNLTNDVIVTKIDGVSITRIPFELDQTDVNFDQNGNLEFIIDKKTDFKYSIVDFDFQFTQPPGFFAEPVSYEMNSKDGYIGSIGKRRFWLTDRLGKSAIKEISVDPNGMKILGYPFENNIVICRKMLAWLERSPDNHFMTVVVAYNTETGKVFVVDKSDTAKFSLQGGDSCIYWADSENPYDNATVVKGYDFDQRKPIKTGIRIYSMDYKYAPVTPTQKLMQENEKSISLWQVVGNGIVYQSISNNDRLAYFEYETGKHVSVDKATYSPMFLMTYWRDPDSRISSDNGYAVTYTAQHRLLHDRSAKGNNIFLAWQKLNKDQSFSTQYTSMGNLQNVATIDKNCNPVLITGNWLIFLISKSEIKDKDWAELLAVNLENGKEINLGSYKIGDSWSLSGYDGMLAWSAWNKDTGYDIFYTRLP